MQLPNRRRNRPVDDAQWPARKGRLVDDAETDLPGGEDRARLLAAPTRVEIVAVEIKQHDPRPFDAFEQRIKPRRIEAPGIVKLVEIAERGGRCRNDRVHVLGGVGRHQGEERAKGLAGEHDAPIALMFQLADLARPAGGCSPSRCRRRAAD